ncbi:MAG: hypothetical protein AAF495_16995 [Pseudomonadota bacterium]
MQRITIEQLEDKAVIRVRDVARAPQGLKFKIEWPAKKETLGPFGWQSAEHFHRPRDVRNEGDDLILELGADVIQAVSPGTEVEVELSDLNLAEPVIWPDLDGGPPAAAPSPQPPPAPPQATEQTEQKDARDFGTPRQGPPAAPAAGASRWRGIAMLLVVLVVGGALGYFVANALAPSKKKDSDAKQISQLEQDLASARGELQQARQDNATLENQIATLKAENAALSQAPEPEPLPTPDPPPSDEGALMEARSALAESAALASRQASQIEELKAEVARLKATVAAQAEAPPEPTPSAIDAAQLDQVLAQAKTAYGISPDLLAQVRSQLLAGETVTEVTGGLKGELPNVARQSLHNQLCQAFAAQCR